VSGGAGMATKGEKPPALKNGRAPAELGARGGGWGGGGGTTASGSLRPGGRGSLGGSPPMCCRGRRVDSKPLATVGDESERWVVVTTGPTQKKNRPALGGLERAHSFAQRISDGKQGGGIRFVSAGLGVAGRGDKTPIRTGAAVTILRGREGGGDGNPRAHFSSRRADP